MRKMKSVRLLMPVYITVIALVLAITLLGNRVVTVVCENAPITDRKCIIIDAGHGGVDGGAISCTGASESNINLEIAKRLNDLCHLLGMDTRMIRTTDISVYTDGETIAAKKISDLKQRVRIINETQNGILVSIHQNKFTQSKYSGAQAFYAKTSGSQELASAIQQAFLTTLNQGSNRTVKRSDGIYLMEHIACPAVLIECGFLSNPEEEAKLRNADYQRKVACVIAASCSSYIHGDTQV